MFRGNKIDKGVDDFLGFWDEWIQTGRPRWEFWRLMDNWWKASVLENVLLVHYDNLIHHKVEEVNCIAEFLKLEVDPKVKTVIPKNKI